MLLYNFIFDGVIMTNIEYLNQFFSYRALAKLVNRAHSWIYLLAKGDRVANSSTYMHARIDKLAEVHRKTQKYNGADLQAQFGILLKYYSNKDLLQLLDKTPAWQRDFLAGDEKTYTFEVANKLAFLHKASGLNGRI